MMTRKSGLAGLATVATAVLLWLGSASCPAITVSELLDTFQNLPQDQQQQLINQIAGDVSNTTSNDQTTTNTPTTPTTSEGGLPLGQAAIAYSLKWSPGRQVKAAVAGTPIFAGDMFEQPVDEPDFWDRVQEVFLEGLMQAIVNTWNIPIGGV